MTSDKKPFKLNLGALAKGSDNEVNNKSIDIKKDTIDNINDVKNSEESIGAKISMNKIKLDTPSLEKENNKQSNIIKEDIIEIIEENNKAEEKDKNEIKEKKEEGEENKKEEESKAKIEEDKKEESKEDKTDESLEKYKVEEDKQILDEKKDIISHKLDLSKMKDNKSKREDDKKEIEELKKEEEEKEVEELKKEEEEKENLKGIEVFENYESDFNKNKGSILDKIKKIKDIVKPKTRTGFLILISIITILGIALLFLFVPERHNLNTYETNLKAGIGKIECSFDSTKCPKVVLNPVIIEKEPVIIEKEPVIIEKEPVIIEKISKKTIKKGVFTIEYETKFVDGEEIIIYKGENYTNIDGFNTIIEKEINIQKREKLKDYIINLQK